MMRFYIKNNEVSFSIRVDDFTDSDAVNRAAALVNTGYDSYIDKDTDHPRWELVDGNLSEIPMERAMAETAIE